MLSTGVSTLQLLSHPQQPPRLHHLAEEHKKVQVTICTKRGVSHLHLIFLTSLYNDMYNNMLKCIWNCTAKKELGRGRQGGQGSKKCGHSLYDAVMMHLYLQHLS